MGRVVKMNREMETEKEIMKRREMRREGRARRR